MQCFILAGGYATRLWPLTEKRAKPLLPLAGKPLISHLVEQVPRDLRITVSTNAAFETGFRMWQEHMKNENLHLVIEDTKHETHKLGALGALASWIEEEKIDDDILVLTGDNYLGFAVSDFLAAYDGSTPLLAAHDIGDLRKASAFGTVLTKEGWSEGDARVQSVTGFEEKPLEPKTTLVSTGCVVLPKHTLKLVRAYAALKPDNLGGIFEYLLAEGVAVQCYRFTEPWLDIGTFESYLAAHKLLTEGTVQEKGSALSKSTCYGSVALGPNTHIEGSTITDCLFFGDCIITDCTLTRCIVDEGCVLRGVDLSGKMLRAGTELVLEN